MNGAYLDPVLPPESCTIEHAPDQAVPPITVPPRIRANGSTTVSIPMATTVSTLTVSGFSMRDAGQHQFILLAPAEDASTLASSSRSLIPRLRADRRSASPARVTRAIENLDMSVR